MAKEEGCKIRCLGQAGTFKALDQEAAVELREPRNSRASVPAKARSLAVP